MRTILDYRGTGTVAQLAQRMEQYARAEETRTYIGASVVGTACDRALYYVHDRAPRAPIPSRVLRIFDFGHAVETLVVGWLRAAGLVVYDTDPTTGAQFRVRTDDSTLQGHLDGVVSSTPLHSDLFTVPSQYVAILEVKSHKSSKYDDVVSHGVQHAAFTHYAQMQVYMGASESVARALCVSTQSIHHALYVAVNKDNSEIYLEEVTYDKQIYRRLVERTRDTIRARTPPPRLADAAHKSPCKFCDYQVHCFQDNRTPSFS